MIRPNVRFHEVSIDESGEEISLEFTNIQYGKICVYKFQDLNANGTQDQGEPSVSGITINLYNETMVLIATTVTNETGWACFSNLELGTYYIEEEVPDGWFSDGPLVQMVILDESGEDRIRDLR